MAIDNTLAMNLLSQSMGYELPKMESYGEVATMSVTADLQGNNIWFNPKQNDTVKISAEAYNLYSAALTRKAENGNDSKAKSTSGSAEKTSDKKSLSPLEETLERLQEYLDKAVERLGKAFEKLGQAMAKLSNADNEAEKAMAQAQVDAAQHEVIAALSMVMKISTQIAKLLHEKEKKGKLEIGQH